LVYEIVLAQVVALRRSPKHASHQIHALNSADLGQSTACHAALAHQHEVRAGNGWVMR
jgi:hypothetical protein